MVKNIRDKNFLNQLTGFDIPWEKDKGEVLQEIIPEIQARRPKVVRLGNRRVTRSVAALLIILLGTALFMRFHERSLESGNGEHLTHQLPDGSIVELNSGSNISYHPFWWRFERSLKFEGEAFFMVQKGKSFKVLSTLAETKVLGTSFSIFSRNRDYRVICHTGKVKVTSLISDHSALIEPNQEAILELDGKFKLNSREVLPEPVHWKAKLFEFTGSPLEEVLEEIERQYDVNISYPDNLSYYYTGGVDANRDIETSLNLVCKPFKITFEEISEGEYRLFEDTGKDN